ncbi:MAG: SH3 domain-containing protein [Hyphomonadaceae bacterium]
MRAFAHPSRRLFRFPGLAALWIAALAASSALAQTAPDRPAGGEPRFQAYAGEDLKPRISNFSGLPVPRYSSLREAPVNGRAGPSFDYPVRWRYQVAGLPVVVVKESQDWRKVRDPQGDEIWVHRSMLAGDRTTISVHAGAVRSEPDLQAAAVARYGPGVVMALSDCRLAWCRVEAAGRRGWALRAELWGADDLPAVGD